MNQEQFQKLYQGYLDQSLSESEIERFFGATKEPQFEQYLSQLIDESAIVAPLIEDEERKRQVWEYLHRSRKGKVVLLPRQRETRRVWMVAAAFFLLVLGTWWIFQAPKPSLSTPQLTQVKYALPGRDAAILTLSDGSQVVLDSTKGTIINNNNGVQIINTAGLLSYVGEGVSGEIVYNTISTARGNRYQLLLGDGTKVWLNSATSLKYPVAFNGKERRVELTGEGFFEVAKDKTKPFSVVTSSQEIRVLGTHFNVSSYKDEETVQTTLIEGSVSVKDKRTAVVLKPGSQAMSDGSGLHVNTDVDTDKVISWKQGWFDFDGMDFKMILRQVSRWYDVDVVYKGNIPDEKFGGRIKRDVPLSQVLQLLQNRGVKFQLQGNVITVMP
jgi:ferric-dicitrate binding protein FerR (iron transport regulator)